METPRPQRKPGCLGRLALAVLGLALAGGLELLLRLAGFGGAPPLLRPLFPEATSGSAESRLFEVNPMLGELFFSRRAPGSGIMLGSHRRELVHQPKPVGTWRVVFLGASTVEGFPLPRNLTAARFLEAWLRQALPQHRVEVLNLGMTAVASFPVEKIGEAAIEDLDPDLLVVYSGHNELFGASGVASFQFLGRSPRTMEVVYRLRESALVQAAKALLPSPRATPEDHRRELIQVMAGLDEVPPGGGLHTAARRSLATNLGRLLTLARAHGVPTVLCTLVSNERDLAPLASYEGDLPEAQRAGFRRHLARAEARAARDPRGAIPELTSLATQAPRHAGTAYALARALEAAEGPAASAGLFRRARDLDALPWRADSDLNRVLRELAARRGTTLADCEETFARAAGGAPGFDLFYDHVHPSLAGQALLAHTVYEAIVHAGFLPIGPAAVPPPPDWHRTAAALGADPLERFLVAHKMAALFSVPPIGDHNAAAARRFRTLVEEIRRGADPIDRAAIAAWQAASARAGFALPISFFGATAALSAGEPERAAIDAAGAVANAYPLSDERSAAELVELLAWHAGSADDRVVRELPGRLRETELVARMGGQPSALLSRARLGMLALAGRREEARRELRRAGEPERDAPAVVRAFLAQLPSAADLLATQPAGEAVPGPPTDPPPRR